MPLLERIQLAGDRQPTADEINRLQTNIERALRRLQVGTQQNIEQNTVVVNPASTSAASRLLAPLVVDGGDDEAEMWMPGPPGQQGKPGVGSMGPPGLDGDDPEEPMIIIGPPGPRGARGMDGMPAFDSTVDEDASEVVLPTTLSSTSLPALGARFIVQVPSAHLPNAQALSALASGVMHSVTGTGVVSTLAVGANLVPYGSGVNGALTASTGLQFNGTSLGIGAASPSSTYMLWIERATAPYFSVRSTGATSYSGLSLINSVGLASEFGMFLWGPSIGGGLPVNGGAFQNLAGGPMTFYNSGVKGFAFNNVGLTTAPSDNQGVRLLFNDTIASAAGVTWDSHIFEGGTLTLTGTTTITSVRKNRFGRPTITDASAVAVTRAATVSIEDAPVAGGSVTLTASYALDVVAGASSFGGDIYNSSLTAGGVVYGVAATGRLKIGTAAEVAAAITWPTATHVLVSSGATTAPIGYAGFTYDGTTLLDSNASTTTEAARVRTAITNHNNPTLIVESSAATGEAVLHFRSNSGLRAGIRGDFAGNVGLFSTSGGIVMFTGGDSGTGTSKVVVANSGNVTLTPAVSTSGSPTLLTLTGPAHTTLAASTEATDVNFNLARTVQWATGDITTQRAFRVQAPTYAFVGASTIEKAVTLAISGAPVAGTNASIDASYALHVESGRSLFSGPVFVTPTAGTGTQVPGLRYQGAAHTALTASAELNDVYFNLTRTVQWATGAIATQRAVYVGAPTYGFVGASVITKAATVSIAGAPAAGANATITASYALDVEAGDVRVGALAASSFVKTTALSALTTVSGVPSASYKWSISYRNSATGIQENSETVVVPGDSGAIDTAFGGLAAVGGTAVNVTVAAAFGTTTAVPMYRIEGAHGGGGVLTVAIPYMSISGAGTVDLEFTLWYATAPATSGTYTQLASIAATGFTAASTASLGNSATFATNIPDDAFLFVAIRRTDNASTTVLSTLIMTAVATFMK